jgi:hypothetical protein
LYEDRGIVQFIVGTGALEKAAANITALATPTVNKFDLTPIAQILAVYVLISVLYKHINLYLLFIPAMTTKFN